MEETRFYIQTVYRLSGQSITEELVKELATFWGTGHTNTRIAQATLESLKPVASPSLSYSQILENAPVAIPNNRTSNTPRNRGRSVD